LLWPPRTSRDQAAACGCHPAVVVSCRSRKWREWYVRASRTHRHCRTTTPACRLMCRYAGAMRADAFGRDGWPCSTCAADAAPLKDAICTLIGSCLARGGIPRHPLSLHFLMCTCYPVGVQPAIAIRMGSQHSFVASCGKAQRVRIVCADWTAGREDAP
jgi:hypothetical protein